MRCFPFFLGRIDNDSELQIIFCFLLIYIYIYIYIYHIYIYIYIYHIYIYIHIYRERDIQIDRQTDRQIDRQIDSRYYAIWGYWDTLSMKIPLKILIKFIYFIVYFTAFQQKINYKTYKFYRFFKWNFLRAKCSSTTQLYTSNVLIKAFSQTFTIFHHSFHLIVPTFANYYHRSLNWSSLKHFSNPKHFLCASKNIFF